MLCNFWQRNTFLDTLASVDSSKRYVQHISSDSQAQVLWTYVKASFGASPSWSNYKWVTPELGVEVVWKKVSIPYQSPATSSCGCEKSQAELCPSELITPASLLRGVQRPCSNTASGVVTPRATMSLGFCICLQTARWAVTLNTSKQKFKGCMGGMQNSIMYAESPENLFSWWGSRWF